MNKGEKPFSKFHNKPCLKRRKKFMKKTGVQRLFLKIEKTAQRIRSNMIQKNLKIIQ